MTDKVNSESSAAMPGDLPRPKKPRAKKSAAAAEPKKTAAGTEAAGSKGRKIAARSGKTKSASKAAPKKKSANRRNSAPPVEAAKTAPAPGSITNLVQDPIGDTTDGEARVYTGEELQMDADGEAEAYRAGVAADAVDGTLEPHEPGPNAGIDGEAKAFAPAKIADLAKGRAHEDSIPPRPGVRLERLQKILSQAGIASRRHAEEMIVAGRVAVNGQVVTTLGSKADPEHDHIRVDGKLLHGAERHRYFVLNKPKGYVTTVSDPEGRPTVMDFVSRLGERVYPVGRLDFQSEGLLLMTNDGALANQLTHASSGVEKTYLVKVAGQPDEEELDRLRSGIMIERGGPSASGLKGPGGRVRTAPASIRQIRPGENPWYEVILTEGRNRELCKMFSAIGHYVEKIRRVAYGPLVLDLEPGKLRELTLEEVDALRQTAEGKLKPRRLKAESMLPKEAGRTVEPRSGRPAGRRSSGSYETKPYGKPRPERGPEQNFRGREQKRNGPGDFRGRAKPQYGSQDRPQREFRSERREWQPRPAAERPARPGRPEAPRRNFGPRREEGGRSGPPQRDFRRHPDERSGQLDDREARNRPNRSDERWRKSSGERPFRPEGRPARISGDKSRFGGPSKFAGKSRSGGSFGNERKGRDSGGFSGKGKPGGFRSGPRPGGSRFGGSRPAGPRPGGRGGKRSPS
jgi:23S rRNA pseudouridine2605 synthase